MIRFQQTLLKNYLYISKTFLLYNVNLCFYFFYNDLHVACPFSPRESNFSVKSEFKLFKALSRAARVIALQITPAGRVPGTEGVKGEI